MQESHPQVRTARLFSTPILMYHSVSISINPLFRRFTLNPLLFAAHMAYLAQEDYRTFTVSEFVRLRRSGCGEFPEKTVLLTFDDAFADFYTAVLPVLRRYALAATLYVPTRYVGESSRWLLAEGETDRSMLTWTQLREIASSGVECAGHSHTHPQLDRLPARQLAEEVYRPKQVLEDRLQIPVRSFAYPFGYYNRSVRQAVEDAGYSSACAVKDFTSTARDDVFLLPRRTVSAVTDVSALARLLEGRRPTAISRGVAEGKRLAWQAWRQHGPARNTTDAANRTAGQPGS